MASENGEHADQPRPPTTPPLQRQDSASTANSQHDLPGHGDAGQTQALSRKEFGPGHPGTAPASQAPP